MYIYIYILIYIYIYAYIHIYIYIYIYKYIYIYTNTWILYEHDQLSPQTTAISGTTTVAFGTPVLKSADTHTGVLDPFM